VRSIIFTLVPITRATLEDRDPGSERLGREGVAQLVGAAPANPGRLERWIPVARPPAVEADVPTPSPAKKKEKARRSR
jgi:hypothetical protein